MTIILKPCNECGKYERCAVLAFEKKLQEKGVRLNAPIKIKEVTIEMDCSCFEINTKKLLNSIAAAYKEEFPFDKVSINGEEVTHE